VLSPSFNKTADTRVTNRGLHGSYVATRKLGFSATCSTLWKSPIVPQLNSGKVSVNLFHSCFRLYVTAAKPVCEDSLVCYEAERLDHPAQYANTVVGVVETNHIRGEFLRLQQRFQQILHLSYKIDKHDLFRLQLLDNYKKYKKDLRIVCLKRYAVQGILFCDCHYEKQHKNCCTVRWSRVIESARSIQENGYSCLRCSPKTCRYSRIIASAVVPVATLTGFRLTFHCIWQINE